MTWRRHAVRARVQRAARAQHHAVVINHQINASHHPAGAPAAHNTNGALTLALDCGLCCGAASCQTTALQPSLSRVWAP